MEAEKDLENIFDYTFEKFGVDQAVKYVSSFDNVFDSLVKSPPMGRERKEIRSELSSLAKENHVVFYRIMDSKIRIVRIIHGSRDLPKHFP